MAKKGNCQNTSPQESFFGQMKDKVVLKSCKTFEELQLEINKYINYYNNYKYQWNLKKMSPVEYRNHLLNDHNQQKIIPHYRVHFQGYNLNYY